MHVLNLSARLRGARLSLRLAMAHLAHKPFSRLIVVGSVACILLMNAVVFLLFQSFSRSLADVRSAHFLTAYLESAVPPTKEPDVLSAVKRKFRASDRRSPRAATRFSTTFQIFSAALGRAIDARCPLDRAHTCKVKGCARA